jgi:hypothetical protein
MPLAHEGAMNAPIMQPLANRMDRVPQWHAVAPHSIGVGIDPGPNRGARGRAHRLAIISTFKTNAFPRKAIKVGCFQPGLPIAVQHVITNGLTQNDHNLPRVIGSRSFQLPECLAGREAIATLLRISG